MTQEERTLEEKYGAKYRRHSFGYRMLARFASVFNPIRKQVIFNDFNGKHFSDNPRAIAEKLHASHPEYRLVWVIGRGQKGKDFPDYIHSVSRGSFRYYRELSASCCFVTNEKIGRGFRKRKGQVFIQTWHGDRGIKKILYDSLPPKENEPWIMDEFLTDLFVTGSEYAEKRIQTAFRYHGEVLRTGCPRNDRLVKPGNGDAIRENIGVAPGKKIMLYAPTLRKGQKVVQTRLDIDETLRHLNTRGGDWVCLVRAHPKSLGLNVNGTDGVIDVSDYPDMADLLMIADCLITDYSSCAGDFILRKKPVFLAQYDREQYMEEGRSFYVNPWETGFLIATCQEELNAMIDRMTETDYAENCEAILRYFGTHETGHAAEDVCRWIVSCTGGQPA